MRGERSLVCDGRSFVCDGRSFVCGEQSLLCGELSLVYDGRLLLFFRLPFIKFRG